MRKEIEVKARLRDAAGVERKLEEFGCALSVPVRESDTVFTLSPDDFLKDPLGKNFLRIRERGGKVLFTLKQPQKNNLDRIEREVEVSDAAEMREAIILMGYREGVRVVKRRRQGRCGGYEICLDDVERLGPFIEVEKIAGNEDGEKVQEELFAFLEELGVAREDRVFMGYDQLMLAERGRA